MVGATNRSGAFAFKVCRPWFEADRRMGMIPAIAGFKQSEHLICCAIHRLTTAGSRRSQDDRAHILDGCRAYLGGGLVAGV
jgi:hypothetical protein